MIVLTEQHLEQFIDALYGTTLAVFDTETTGLDWFKEDRIIGYAFYIPDSEHSFYIPVRQETSDNIQPEIAKAVMQRWFNDPENCFIAWNMIFDIHMLRAEGFTVGCQAFDVMYAAHLCWENELKYGLKELGAKYLGVSATEEQEEMKRVGYEWMEERRAPLKARMLEIKSEIDSIVKEHKVEQKEPIKQELKELRKTVRNCKKELTEGEEFFNDVITAIAECQKQMKTINKLKPKDLEGSIEEAKRLRLQTLDGELEKLKKQAKEFSRFKPIENLAKLPLDVVAKYAMKDCKLTWDLYRFYKGD